MPVCPESVHEAMKSSPEWSLLKPIGMQIIEERDDGKVEALEMRNCQCGSTLCKEVVL